MADNETRVVYRAIADFKSLSKAVSKAKKELAALRAEEAALNASSVKGGNNASTARHRATEAIDKQAAAVDKEANAISKGATAAANAVAAQRQLSDAKKSTTAATNQLDNASQRLTNSVSRAAEAVRKSKQASDSASSSHRRQVREVDALGNAFQRGLNRANQFQKGLVKVGNWRPRLTPPFIALIPIIGAVLALIGPLVSGLGAVGSAALGFGSSLGSLAGSAIAVLPALGALLSVVGALKSAFSGVGNVFKAYGAMKKATGGGGGGGGGATAPALAELSITEKITRAQEAYRRSIQDVAFAQEDLDDARKGYIKRLSDLQKAVDRAAMSEARAAANTQLARENYANVLADPGSTKGDKMLAQVDVDEAVTDQRDVIDENKQNVADLNEMKQKGIDGDRDVVMATRAVTDALNAQRDAQLALANAGKDTAAATGGGGAAGAIDEFQAALDKLSPSARSVVLQLLAMEGAFTKMKLTIQEAFFSEIVNDIKLINRLFPVTTSLLSGVATSLGQVASQFLRMITGDQWLEDIGTFGEFAQPFVKDIGEGLLFILDGLKDVTIAALPFTRALGQGFRQGAQNFRELMGSARADGSLETYLDGVLDRLRQWWRITKNIAKTLVNYGTASGQFADWLTDGFEAITEGWLDSSEEAKEAGSPFKDYLEDIKPLLSDINGLLGDFFGWLGDTMADPKNIKTMQDIIGTIRDDLGPAVADIIDKLAETGVGESFVEALSSIVEVIDTLVANGGADAIKAFFEAVQLFFDVVKDIVGIPGAGGVIYTIALALGGLAALSFVGKFTGLTNLFGWLIRLSKTKGITGLLTKLGGLKALSALGLGGAAASKAGAGAAALDAAKAADPNTQAPVYATRAERKEAERKALVAQKDADKAAARQAKADRKAGVAPTYTSRAERKQVESKAERTRNNKALGKSVGIGVVTALASVATGNAAESIRSNNTGSSPEASGARIGANALEGAGTGAAIGATIGSVIPGVGTAAGAGIGAGVGATAGVLSSSQEDIDAFDQMVNDWIDDLFKRVIPEKWEEFKGWVNGWADPINEKVNTWLGAGSGEPLRLFFAEKIPEWWEGFKGWVNGWADPINEKVNTWIADQGQNISDFFTVTIPQWWTDFQGSVNAWGDPINSKVNTWLADRGRNIQTFFTQTIPGWWEGFRGWVNGWSDPINSKVNSWMGGAGRGIYDFFFVTIPGWWGDFKGWVNGWSNPINEKVNSWVSSARTTMSNFFNNLPGMPAPRASQTKGNRRNNGGPIRRAGGGGVPGRGNSDTVSAMLTPGEYVIRKAVVNRIGMENLARLNSGVMSYAQMLQQAAAAKSGDSKGKNDTMGLGLGGAQPAFFSAGGLVPPYTGGGSGPTPFTPPTFEKGTGESSGGGPTFGDINIYNPEPERASDSLPRTVRKVAYLGTVRSGDK